MLGIENEDEGPSNRDGQNEDGHDKDPVKREDEVQPTLPGGMPQPEERPDKVIPRI